MLFYGQNPLDFYRRFEPATPRHFTIVLMNDYSTIPKLGKMEYTSFEPWHGSQFTAAKWYQALEQHGINAIRSSEYHSKSNPLEITNNKVKKSF